MNDSAIYLRQFKNFSEALTGEIARVPEDVFNRRPGPGLNPVGWNYFHLLRIWDLDINWICRGQKPDQDAWHRGGFTEKSGYDPDGKGWRGTGVGYAYTDNEVDELAIGADVLSQYHDMLLTESESYLGSSSNEELHRLAPTVLNPDIRKPVFEQIEHTIAHSYGHIGEIRYAMGMFGLHDHSYPVSTA
jgi:hypothetical protein